MTAMDKTEMIKARPASLTLCTHYHMYVHTLNTYSPTEAVNQLLQSNSMQRGSFACLCPKSPQSTILIGHRHTEITDQTVPSSVIDPETASRVWAFC